MDESRGRDTREISPDVVVTEGQDSHPQRPGQRLVRQREQMEERPEGVKWHGNES